MFSRRFFRLVHRAAIRLLMVAAIFTLASYVVGEWDAGRTEAAQHDVWSAYLNTDLDAQAAPAGPGFIVVQDHTERAHRPLLLGLLWPAYVAAKERPYSRFPTLHPSAYIRYLLGSLRSHPVRPRLTLPVAYRLASAEEVATYGQDWKRWEALFPNAAGYFALSNVGFNADGTQALLYVEHVCGLCGHGGYILMRKANGRWSVEAEAGTWVS